MPGADLRRVTRGRRGAGTAAWRCAGSWAASGAPAPPPVRSRRSGAGADAAWLRLGLRLARSGRRLEDLSALAGPRSPCRRRRGDAAPGRRARWRTRTCRSTPICSSVPSSSLLVTPSSFASSWTLTALLSRSSSLSLASSSGRQARAQRAGQGVLPHRPPRCTPGRDARTPRDPARGPGVDGATPAGVTRRRTQPRLRSLRDTRRRCAWAPRLLPRGGLATPRRRRRRWPRPRPPPPGSARRPPRRPAPRATSASRSGSPTAVG